MPIVRNIPLNLDPDLVFRRIESGPQKILQPKYKTLIKELLGFVKDHNLLKPAMAYQYVSPKDFFPDDSHMKEIEKLKGSLVSMVLPAAKELALAVVTIGSALEGKVSEYSEQKALLKAMMLDSIGSAALDILCLEASHIIGCEVESTGFKASSPLCPGMPGIPLLKQKRMFELIPVQKIGVCLNTSQLMSPQKSVSMIIGIGPDMPTWTRAHVCARCSLNNTCGHRILPQKHKCIKTDNKEKEI